MKMIRKMGAFLSLAWKTCPSYVVLLFAKALLTSANVLLNVYLPKLLIDALISGDSVSRLVMFGALIVANNVLFVLVRTLIERSEAIKKTLLNNLLKKLLSSKIMNLEYSYLEDPYYLDLKERALFAIYNQSSLEQTISMLADFITQVFTMVTLLVILATLGYVIILGIVVCALLCILLYGMLSKHMIFLQNELIPINRQYGYYYDLSNGKEFQKDMRLFGMEGLLFGKIQSFIKEIFKSFYALFNHLGLAMGAMEAIMFLFSAFCYIYVGMRTVSSDFGPVLSIGDLTLYVTSAISFTSMIVKFGYNLSNLGRYMVFLDPYFEFISLAEETVETGEKEKFSGDIQSLEFRNVTFTYPKAEKPVLEDISFEVRKGQKISIVGLNGAGKSTLVKLICRMYRADSGEILVNGKNIYDYDYLSYMAAIATVFQDYKLFNFTIQENITCSPVNTDGQDAGGVVSDAGGLVCDAGGVVCDSGASLEEQKVMSLLKEVGIDEAIAALPHGIKSRFGKEYNKDGVELSGGQSQKIAIARALYKDSSMVILDEPASALDPISEAEIYEKFNSLVSDKTAIYISHRMSSSVFCDRILIIDGGRVSDFDTHQNLMAKKDSLYYKLFMAQADNYQLEEGI